MLTNAEERYLLTIPKDKKVTIAPYSTKLSTIAESLINKVKVPFPELDVVFMGASGLGISGQGDIDLYALSPAINFQKYLPTLKQIFGNPEHEHKESVEWAFIIEGINVEFYLTDPQTESMKRQIKVFQILKKNNTLLDEYRILKEKMNGKSMREYQRRKYEFYNRILAQFT